MMSLNLSCQNVFELISPFLNILEKKAFSPSVTHEKNCRKETVCFYYNKSGYTKAKYRKKSYNAK